MKKKIAKKIEKASMNIISGTGSWTIFGEKKIPEEMVAEYKKSKK